MTLRKKIKDSVVVITGASSGIGRATALMLAKQGANVVLASRQEDALAKVAEECRKYGVKALGLRIDVSNRDEVCRLSDTTLREMGRIDVWINNAAVAVFGRIDEVPHPVYRRVIETNLFGYIHGAQVAVPVFRSQGYGTLINVSSVAGKIGAPYGSAYHTSKFAVTGLSESLRMELKDYPDIHVTTILPASIDTPFFRHAANFSGRRVKPMSPVYSPESVARAITRSIERPRGEVMVGNSGRLLVAQRRLLRRIGERFFARMVEKEHFVDVPENMKEGNVFIPPTEQAAIRGGWGGKDTRSTGFLALSLLSLAAGAFLLTRPKRRHAPLEGVTGIRRSGELPRDLAPGNREPDSITEMPNARILNK